MLTRQHAVARYENGRIVPDRLTRQSHAAYLDYARRMLLVYRGGLGRTRRELHQTVHNIFAHEIDCSPRRIDAFCKLLDDASEFAKDKAGEAAKLRRTVFRAAAAKHPLLRQPDTLFEHAETAVKDEIARRLGKTWDEVDAALFADIMDFHRLQSFDPRSELFSQPTDLLARYNVAQAQVALYSAVEMIVWANSDFKTILRYAKLARLMHTIQRTPDGTYVIRFDGPASVLRETRRYGVAMAKFLPALLACQDWRMHAVVQTPRLGWRVSFDLSPDDRLNSHLPPTSDFDSSVEETFAKRWGNKPRDGWRLIREGDILHRDQKVFVPDFSLRHEDGRMRLLEIVGFWTPEYLQAKLHTLRTFRDHGVLLAVAESVCHEMPKLPADTIRFKSALKVRDVLERL